ncbi:MAG TPA: tetratricopeptide repeat protein [Vulgatibacter sp.]
MESVDRSGAARRVAAELSAWFEPGGTWFCDLSSVSRANDLRAAVASSLGIAATLDDTAGDSLDRAIASRGRLLLVLDNIEYSLPDAGAVLGGWLDRCPGAQLLVTSLVRVGIEGETCLDLEPLPAEDAATLYRDRAFRASAGRSLAASDERAIAELVDRLDRIPLAIELAAARVQALPPRRFLARIDRRFELLQAAGRKGRHGSLHRAISCSWELLDRWERLALAQMSIFAGGCTLEAAEEILDCGEGAPSTLDLLESLRHKSLLHIDEGALPRLSLYESVRAYAALELEALGGPGDLTRRHAAYFLRLGEEWEAASEGADGAAALQNLRLERGNLLAAHRRTLESDPSTCARLALALAPIVTRQGTPEVSIGLLDAAVDCARRAADRRLLLRAHLARAKATVRLGRIESSRADVDEALSLCSGVDDPRLEGRAWVELGWVLSYRNDFDAAEDAYRGALTVGLRASDRLIQGLAHNGLGAVQWYRGDADGAGAEFERALALIAGTGHVHSEAMVRVNRGVALASSGRHEAARRHLEEALRLFGLLGDVHAQGNVLGNLGNVELQAGRLDEAEGVLLRAIPIEQQSGNRRCEGVAVGNLGLVAFDRGDLRLADRRLREGIALLRASGDGYLAIQLVPFLGGVEAMLGDPASGRSQLEEARAWFTKVGDQNNLAGVEVMEALVDLALARLASGRDESLGLVEQARQRIEAVRGGGRSHLEPVVLALRIAERAAGGWSVATPGPSPEAGTTGLVVGGDGAWFQLGDGARVDLGSRGPLRRILVALAEQRRIGPGVGLGIPALVEVAWPGERILPQAAANRVYSAIRALRRMGLGDELLRHDDGYLLSPSLSVRFG